MAYMLKLPDERGEQLRQIAAAKNTTIPELIAAFIRSEIEAGTIPAALPGVEVSNADGEIIVRAANGFEVTIPASQGPTLADVLSGAAVVSYDPISKSSWLAAVAALSGIKVKRMGQGVRLVSPLTGKEYPLALNVATDLAYQISKASK